MRSEKIGEERDLRNPFFSIPRIELSFLLSIFQKTAVLFFCYCSSILALIYGKLNGSSDCSAVSVSVSVDGMILLVMFFCKKFICLSCMN